MSKSRLKDNYIKRKYKEGKEHFYNVKQKVSYKNKHRLDEMPKNKPSKLVSCFCKAVSWLQEPGSFGGHKPKKGGHRMVSGIVRAKNKENIKRNIEQEIDELNFDDIKIIPEKH